MKINEEGRLEGFEPDALLKRVFADQDVPDELVSKLVGEEIPLPFRYLLEGVLKISPTKVKCRLDALAPAFEYIGAITKLLKDIAEEARKHRDNPTYQTLIKVWNAAMFITVNRMLREDITDFISSSEFYALLLIAAGSNSLDLFRGPLMVLPKEIPILETIAEAIWGEK